MPPPQLTNTARPFISTSVIPQLLYYIFRDKRIQLPPSLPPSATPSGEVAEALRQHLGNQSVMPVHVVAEHLAIAGPSAVIAQLDTARATVRGWSEDLRQELQDLKREQNEPHAEWERRLTDQAQEWSLRFEAQDVVVDAILIRDLLNRRTPLLLVGLLIALARCLVPKAKGPSTAKRAATIVTQAVANSQSPIHSLRLSPLIIERMLAVAESGVRNQLAHPEETPLRLVNEAFDLERLAKDGDAEMSAEIEAITDAVLAIQKKDAVGKLVDDAKPAPWQRELHADRIQ